MVGKKSYLHTRILCWCPSNDSWSYISSAHESSCFTTFRNTEKSVENTTCSGGFLRNFKVLEHVVKHCH